LPRVEFWVLSAKQQIKKKMEDKMLMEKRFISLFFYFQQFTTPKLPAFTKRGKKKIVVPISQSTAT